MHLTPYQIVVPLFCLVLVLYAWNLAMRQKKTLWEACFWTVFWGAIAGIAFYPHIIAYLSALTGIQNQESAVLVTFLGILFFMVFYLVIRLEELEQRQTKMIRALALKDAGLAKKKDEEEDKD